MTSDETPMLEIAGDDAPPGVEAGVTMDDEMKVSIDVGDDEKKVEEPSVSMKEVFGRLINEITNMKCSFFLGILGGMGAGGAFAMWSYLFGDMMTILSGVDVRDQALKILIYFYAMGGAFGLCIYFSHLFFISIAGKIGAYMRIQFYDALLYMEMSFYDQESTGALSAKISSAAKVIEVGLGNQCALAFQSLGMFLGGFIVSFVGSWLFTLILLALVPVVAIGGAISGKFISEMSKKSEDIYSEASARSAEVLSGFETILSLNAARSEAARYEALIKKNLYIVKKKAFRIGGAMGALQFINNGFFYGVGMYIGGVLVGQHQNSGGKRGVEIGDIFVAFFGMFIAGIGIGQFAAYIPDISSALSSCQELFEVIDRAPVIRKPDDGKEGIKMKVSGRITFENVSFAYPTRPEVEVLRNINLEIGSGETVAFVGPSGCGKSTMVALLERFYDPAGGRILIDGVPIWNIDLRNWRGQLGFVGQEPVLFDGTIANNILTGTENYTQSDVEKAAKQANAHDFIKEFPDGYETKVGEGGGQLSGGQKQRISIARALVRNPQMLLLDEATSALDTESEQVVQEALDKIIAQGCRTCIVIAHRLSTIINADQIVVFRDGEIVQVGKYDDLSKDTNGVFHAMLMAQDVLGVDALKPKQMDYQKSGGSTGHYSSGTLLK